MNLLKTDRDTQRFSTRRLEALTDGVFAIAMTLLVLDLHVSDIGRAATNHELWEGLQAMQLNIISFVVSFLLLGSMWAVHVRQFEYIKQADRRLTMINTLRLLAVVLIPFTTSLSATYPDIALARVIFPINFFLLALVSFWQWDYATRKENKLYEKLSAAELRRGRLRNLTVVYMAALVSVGALFIGEWAFLLFALMPIAINTIAGYVKDGKKTI